MAQDSSGGYDLTESKHTAYCRELRSAVGESADEPMTWGEVAQRSDGALDRIEDITAPEELKDYHSALIAVIKANIDFYGRQDSSEPFNPELGPQDDEVVAEIVALVAVSRALDREIVSQMLVEAALFDG